MDALPGTAAFTGGEVVFVVATHFRRKTGDVIPPAGQNLADDGINALAHTRCKLRYSRTCSGSDCAASMTWLSSSVRREPRALTAASRASSGWLFCSEMCASTIYDALPSYWSRKKSARASLERCPTRLMTRCFTDQG